MGQPPTYAGTRGRAPCPVCKGSGVDALLYEHRGMTYPCIACNGTKVKPINRADAALRASARVAGIRRAQRAR